MSKIKLLTVVGARPQFIKAGALSRIINTKKDQIQEVIVHTGQHYDRNMSELFFVEMNIPLPRYNLCINGGSHGAMTGKMLEGLEEVLLKEQPDCVLVYGDTNSTLAGALSAKKMHIPVAHVEAGLRSYNMQMPEEINRILTDRISDLLFCPNQNALDILKIEGFDHFACQLVFSGDVMLDATMYYKEIASSKSSITKQLDLEQEYVLATIHRAENTNDPRRITSIITALNELHSERPVIVPIHPRTEKRVKELSLNIEFKCIAPVGYFDMIQLIKHSSFIMTDSGGLQKEAYFFGKSCVVLRDQTEWTELVEIGNSVLVGANKEEIISNAIKLINSSPSILNDYTNIYGDGNASNIILEKLIKYFEK